MTSLSSLVTSLEVGQTNDDEFLKTTFPKKNLNQGEQLLVFLFSSKILKKAFFYSSHRNDKNHRWSVGTNLFTKFWALQDNICTGAHCRAGTGQRCSSFEPAQVTVSSSLEWSFKRQLFSGLFPSAVILVHLMEPSLTRPKSSSAD